LRVIAGLAALHDSPHSANVADVCKRVAIHDHQTRALARFNRADFTNKASSLRLIAPQELSVSFWEIVVKKEEKFVSGLVKADV